MLKICFNAPHALQDQIFDRQSKYNRDDCLYPLVRLKERLNALGHVIHTQDILAPEQADLLIHQDYDRNLRKSPGKNYLFAIESGVVAPQNFDPAYMAQFDRVFTWNDDVVDHQKVIKVNYSHAFPADFKISNLVRTKEVCLINSNKSFRHPFELYTARRKAIAWFQKNAPSKFELYGMGWDKHLFTGPRPVRALNRVPGLQKLLSPRYSFFKGPADPKKPIMQQFWFNLCYENAYGFPGYISEKIFDSFLTGAIPMYWGAPNVLKYVPANTFISVPDFKNPEDAFQFALQLPLEDRRQYQKNIEDYINSSAKSEFTADAFAHTFVSTIQQDFNLAPAATP